MENMIKIRDFVVQYGDEVILKNLNLDIPLSGVTVLIGKSGSGKTTLLRSLNRLNEMKPDHAYSGSITVCMNGRKTGIFGIRGDRLHEVRRRIGMVFQMPNPLPLSIRRNIALPMELVLHNTHEEIDRKIDEVLHLVGLENEVEGVMDKLGNRLSGGQQQRLCLARALALEPEILLLDEPTASLDRKASMKIEELIASLAERYPVIMTSHSLGQALRLADRLIVMNEGEITATLEKGEVKNELALEKLL